MKNEILINQRDKLAWYAGMTVRDVLTAMKYSYPHIIVSINGKVVPYDAYEATEVPDGADVRAIHLSAGG